MSDETLKIPRMALLGVTERARYNRAGRPELSTIDLLGLRYVVPSFLFPLDLSSFSLVLAAYSPELAELGTTVLRDEDGNELFRVELQHKILEGPFETITSESEDNRPDAIFAIGDQPAWRILLVPLSGQILDKPKMLQALQVTKQGEIGLGQLHFILAQVPALTPDRLAAIKSDPRSSKSLRMDLGCKYCESKMRIYATIDKPTELDPGLIWYQDVPESFECSCGRTKFPLESIRSNAHALLGRTNVAPRNVRFSMLYERGALDEMSQEFLELLDRDTGEEEVQQFLSKNPIIFHFLAPYRLFDKPPILSKHKADFAVLDARGILTLVELERPGIRILRKDEAASADMEHAISQVRDWLFQYERHRAAVLECLNLKDHEVTQVRGLVIAGRDKNAPAEALRKFKWQDRGAIDCMTYDDLLSMFTTLSREVSLL